MAEHLPQGPEHLDPAELQRRYEEKKRILEASGGTPEAKAVFRESFKEEVAARFPEIPPLQAAELPYSSAPVAGGDELTELVALALEKGIAAAVKKAERESPYLIDALHDELADHYYEKLVAAGKLNPD